EEAPASTEKQDTAEPDQSKVNVSETKATGDGRIIASPLAKKLAEDKGVDISQIKGSGEGGRIIKRDVESFDPASVQDTTKQAVETAPGLGKESYTDEKLSQMRKVIAKRLAESKFNAPHFYQIGRASCRERV